MEQSLTIAANTVQRIKTNSVRNVIQLVWFTILPNINSSTNIYLDQFSLDRIKPHIEDIEVYFQGSGEFLAQLYYFTLR